MQPGLLGSSTGILMWCIRRLIPVCMTVFGQATALDQVILQCRRWIESHRPRLESGRRMQMAVRQSCHLKSQAQV